MSLNSSDPVPRLPQTLYEVYDAEYVPQQPYNKPGLCQIYILLYLISQVGTGRAGESEKDIKIKR